MFGLLMSPFSFLFIEWSFSLRYCKYNLQICNCYNQIYLKLQGVQFHPESIISTEGKVIVSNFVKLIERKEAESQNWGLDATDEYLSHVKCSFRVRLKCSFRIKICNKTKMQFPYLIFFLVIIWIIVSPCVSCFGWINSFIVI